LPLVNKK